MEINGPTNQKLPTNLLVLILIIMEDTHGAESED